MTDILWTFFRKTNEIFWIW